MERGEVSKILVLVWWVVGADSRVKMVYLTLAGCGAIREVAWLHSEVLT